MMITSRNACLRLAISAALAMVAALCTAPGLRAQSASMTGAGGLGRADLNWQQRFLGILPLIKPDPKDPVMVTVDGHPITAAAITDYARTERQMINATSTEETKAVFKDATENLINRQLLIDEAERRKIEIPDAQVAERAREFKVAGGNEPALPGAAPDAQLMAAVRGSMMIEKMFDDEFRAQKVRPTPAQIKQYYDQHHDLFVKDPGEVQISHIAVKLPDNPTDAQKAAAHDKILKLYKEAQHAKDFAALAKANSEDSHSAAKGGDLGYFHPGQLPPVVEKAVFATPVGHLTEIFESNLGYSFIKVTARRGESFATLKEVQPKIAMVILDYNEDAVVKKTLEQLQRKAKIEFHKPPGAGASSVSGEQAPD
jgi:parvulin-like peptidyl-prolyl isomerase